MEFRKKKLADSDQGYSITTMKILGEDRIIAASEGRGPAVVFSSPSFGPAVLADKPGGCMGFAPIPDRDDAMMMITEFYPIFKSEAAGIHLYKAVDGLNTPWEGQRIIDLPFVHRITVLPGAGASYLVAATICGGKDFQDDWSRPGTVYAAEIPPGGEGEWQLTPVLKDIHRNHGMCLGTYNNLPCVYISGDEGVIALIPPETLGDEWRAEQILTHQVSEIFFADLDNDGQLELAAIEPFHGDTLSVYKQDAAVWRRVFSAKLGFGHGLWAGTFSGEQVVFAGNRSETKNLVCFCVTRSGSLDFEEIVVDKASGTTNIDVIHMEGTDALIASNAEHGEYVMYTAE